MAKHKSLVGKKMIVKVQVPLMSTDPDAMALVYNEDRSFQTMVPIDAEVMRAMGDEPKAFFHATVLKNNVIHLDSDAEWQEW